MTERLRPGHRVRCLRCLGAFAVIRRLARCDKGCRGRIGPAEPVGNPGAARADELSATLGALVFPPRYEHTRRAPARLLDRVLLPATAACPSCRRLTSQWICPLCGADLPGAGLADPVGHAVLLGPRMSGKSTWLAVAAHVLEQSLGPAAGRVVDPRDGATRMRLMGEYLGPVYGSDSAAPARLPATHGVLERPEGVRPITLRLRGGEGGGRTRDAWLSLCDTAGDDWERHRELLAESLYPLHHARGLMYLLDPLRLTAAREALRRVEGYGSPLWSSLDASERPVHLADEVRGLSALLERAGRTVPTETSLAVVLTKLDAWGRLAEPRGLLATLAASPERLRWTPALDDMLHQEVEATLVRWVGETFLQQLEAKFPAFRFFAASALGEPSDPPPAPPHPMMPWTLRPLLWLLEREGIAGLSHDEALDDGSR